MITRETELLKIFKKQLQIEYGSKDEYDQIIKQVKNKDLLKDLTLIRDQEREHISLVEKLIKLMEY
jgi:bacterioferritin (cytochrome b1)